jgi:hypothetical protein
MAIEDGILARIGGTVTYKNDKQTLFKIETNLPGGKYPERTTVWGLAEQVTVGDRVLVQGILTARKGSYVKQDVEVLTVEVSLNKPTIVEHEPATVSGSNAAEESAWASASAPAGAFPADDSPF